MLPATAMEVLIQIAQSFLFPRFYRIPFFCPPKLNSSSALRRLGKTDFNWSAANSLGNLVSYRPSSSGCEKGDKGKTHITSTQSLHFYPHRGSASATYLLSCFTSCLLLLPLNVDVIWVWHQRAILLTWVSWRGYLRSGVIQIEPSLKDMSHKMGLTWQPSQTTMLFAFREQMRRNAMNCILRACSTSSGHFGCISGKL